MNIVIELDIPDDDAHDTSWPFATATAEFMAKFLEVSVSVSDGYGTTKDFGGEGDA
ncbi:hypothetical protein KNV00_gp049 [Streptomyces phage Bmoc]|uniref:Uncharacterized protein n=1 Tax=Streptomyces phage Bmoc TaxID=2725629 RepID=A0A6M3T0F6_9CAUD|nr:hypothetical protein KNV00_gp006 [Streptomyces phage Bmoc]YP_010107621.1 hypothetical protein KNV00_gp049 [Streptomyces phage Bmoc]QJD50756.1 hypothetical protein SEA_BMOC_6 [Streptomyces phage Bmoc]QJD50970.1 hypothetical protein SEA_BMOC_262 [Streptomyces phage Bmoc]